MMDEFQPELEDYPSQMLETTGINTYLQLSSDVQ
jgi:hypothetical protein